MISQQQTQKQQLKILPQQIQLLNLYFLNSMELEQRIKNELEENPMLDSQEATQSDEDGRDDHNGIQDFRNSDEYEYDDIPDYKLEYQNYFNSDQLPEIPIVSTTYFKDELKQQVGLLDIPEDDAKMACFLIDMLNGNGILDSPLEEIADDLSFSAHTLIEVSELERILKIVQQLEPIGVGARNVQECLLLQLEKMDHSDPDTQCAYKLVKNHFSDLMHRQFEKVQHALKIQEDRLREILNRIGSLKFSPVSDHGGMGEPKNTIIPDFLVTREADAVSVSLLHARAESVFVNQSLFDQLSSQCSKKDRSATQYVKGKLQSAQWFVSAIKQREETMLRIMQCIVLLQQEYFLDGDIRLLKPMVLRNVSDMSGYDISTISRITSNKYAETHFGLVYLKDLFSEGIADKKGEVISNKVIQSLIQEAIDAESRQSPYTDQQLVHLLTAKGYNIARRTVAKYREQLQIPIAQIRAVWAS